MNNRFKPSIQQGLNCKPKIVSDREIKYPVRLKKLTKKLII